MDLKEARGRAAEILKDVCKVCRNCDGVACAGQVPGYGGAGTGSGGRGQGVADGRYGRPAAART